MLVEHLGEKFSRVVGSGRIAGLVAERASGHAAKAPHLKSHAKTQRSIERRLAGGVATSIKSDAPYRRTGPVGPASQHRENPFATPSSAGRCRLRNAARTHSRRDEAYRADRSTINAVRRVLPRNADVSSPSLRHSFGREGTQPRSPIGSLAQSRRGYGPLSNGNFTGP